MCHGRVSTSSDAPKLHRFATRRSPAFHASTAQALTLHRRRRCTTTLNFCVLTNDDVIAAIRKLPDKQCATDPLATKSFEGKCGRARAIHH